jgi:hypothetical protein
MTGTGQPRAAASAPDSDFAADHVLRGQLHAGPGLVVLTGGQTGVDSYAARAALEAGLSVHLVFPAGLRQEDGPLTEARRRRLAGAVAHELPSASFRFRTWSCVFLADVVLLLDPAGGTGCLETARAATGLGRPLLEAGAAGLSAAQATDWLTETGAQVLMVAGCRASVLARKGKGPGLRTQLARVMAGVAARSAPLTSEEE